MRGRPRLRRVLLCLLPLFVAGLPACKTHRVEDADRDVYAILAAERKAVPEVFGPLHLDTQTRMARAARRLERYQLKIEEAQALALLTSREFQQAREDVYLRALALTAVRDDYRSVWSGGGSAGVDVDEDAALLDNEVGLVVSQVIEAGGSLALALSLDFLRNLTGSPTRVAQTILDAELLLPLMRGSGLAINREPLIQAERDVIYELRDFGRFQQRLHVTIATRFYRLLELEETWQNEERNFESIQRLVDEVQTRSEVGEIPPFQVNQARQDLLRADQRRLSARNDYEDGLDSFKLDLGLSPTIELTVDRASLNARLAEAERPLPPDARAWLDQAWATRLDLRTAQGREVDSLRAINVARDALRAQLDLVVGAGVSTPGDRPTAFDEADTDGRIGIDLDLPLERLPERNQLRRAMIDAERATRSREALEDQIALEIRRAWRSLAEARRTVEIQTEGVALAARRVEQTELLLRQPGSNVNIRDSLEAQEDLVQARNALTRARIDVAVAWLELERDIGTLVVDPSHRFTLADFVQAASRAADEPPAPGPGGTDASSEASK